MTAQEEQWINEVAEALFNKDEVGPDLQFLELLLHNQVLSPNDRIKVIEIEEKVKRYGVES